MSPAEGEIQSFDTSGRTQSPGNEIAAASSTYNPAHLNSATVGSPEPSGLITASETSDISRIASAVPTPAPRGKMRNDQVEAGIQMAFSDPSPAPVDGHPHSFPTDSVPARDQSPDSVPVLPGVRTGNALFDISTESGDAEEDANPIDIAAVSGLARLSPPV